MAAGDSAEPLDAGTSSTEHSKLGLGRNELERVQKASVNHTGTNFQTRGTFSPEKYARTGQESLAFGARAASSPPSRVSGNA